MALGRKRLIAGWGLVGASALTILALIASSRYSFELGWTSSDADHHTYVGASIQRGTIAAGWSSMWREPGLNDRQTELFEKRLAILSSGREPFVRRDQDFELEWWMPSAWRGSIGIAKLDQSDTSGMAHRAVRVLLWPIALTALGVGTPLLLSGRRLAKRNRAGFCSTCGYDMKGLAGAECPECGKSVRARRASEGESAEV